MPSTNKTPNLGLSQWALTDKPAMEDFNADNLKLDEKLTQNGMMPGASQVRCWHQVATVTSSTKQKILRSDGSDLHNKCAYRIYARIFVTGAFENFAAAFVVKQREGQWIFMQEDYKLKSSNNPKFIQEDGQLYVTLWNHNETYQVHLCIEELPMFTSYAQMESEA